MSQLPHDFWTRLIDQARHCIEVDDYPFAIINAVTALETVFSDQGGKHLKEFFARHDIEYSRWVDRKTRESVTVNLNLLNMLYKSLGLSNDLTERVLDHYRLRNAIVHHGQRNLTCRKASECVDDIGFLIRYILDQLHVSVCLRVSLREAPPTDRELELVRLHSKTLSVTMGARSGLLAASVEGASGVRATLKMDLGALPWKSQESAALALTYNAHEHVIRLVAHQVALDLVKPCDLGYVDATLLTAEFTEEDSARYLPIQCLLVHSREVQPEDLAEMEALVGEVGEEREK